MFKDQKEELQRLEEALRQDQELYEPELPEEFEETPDILPEEFDGELVAETVSDADGWNTDTTDEDLEELSRAVYEAPRRRSPNLLGIAAGLLLLAAALGWLVMKERGLLP